MKRTITAMLAGIAMVIGVLVSPVVATADTGKDCAKELNLAIPTAADAKARTPVILVHGMWGSSGTWRKGHPNMYQVLQSNATVMATFSYEADNAKWVTDSGTDQRLAKIIVCGSKLYGNKKVIIVAHSMGGLLARAALDWAAYGMFAKQAVGHVITIGTPHLGTFESSVIDGIEMTMCDTLFVFLGKEGRQDCRIVEDAKAASAMREGSPQLANLPHFPSGITVEAIAGDRHCSLWGCRTLASGSDTVVNVTSATAEYTSTGVGDGKKVFYCAGIITTAWCSHINLTSAPEVQAEVKASITAYLSSTPTPLALPPYQMYDDFFTRFSVPFLDTWGTSMSEPDSVLNIVDDTTCRGANYECPHINIIDLQSAYGHATYGDDAPGVAVATQVCSADSPHDGWFKHIETRTIGNAQADYYSGLQCASSELSSGNFYAWHIPGRHLLVTAYDTESDTVNQAQLTAVLDNIEWR